MDFIYSEKELLEIVAHLAEQYTSKESTSIPYETAQKLMEAVKYCLKEYEEGEKEQADLASDNVTELLNLSSQQQISLKDAYEKGYQRVLYKTKLAKGLYEKIMQRFCSYGNRSMEDTIQKGMPCFFQRYDARFAPQDTILLLDYPVVRMEEILNHMSGIDAIYEYLLRIRMEQRFLSKFPTEYVMQKLREYHPDHEELLENVGCIIRDAD